MKKLTIKTIISILLSLMAVLLLWNFYLYYHPDSKKLSTVKVKIEKEETAKLRLDGSSLKILTSTNDYSTKRNFIFLDSKTGETVTTLSVSSLGLWTPYYRIIKGNTHDWLVVTRIYTWGTGMKQLYDEWYIIDFREDMKMVLFYPSETMLLNDSDGKNIYWKTEVINENDLNNSEIGINFIKKSCIMDENGGDKDCSETSEKHIFIWDSENEELISKKINNEKNIQ